MEMNGEGFEVNISETPGASSEQTRSSHSQSADSQMKVEAEETDSVTHCASQQLQQKLQDVLSSEGVGVPLIKQEPEDVETEMPHFRVVAFVNPGGESNSFMQMKHGEDHNDMHSMPGCSATDFESDTRCISDNISTAMSDCTNTKSDVSTVVEPITKTPIQLSLLQKVKLKALTPNKINSVDECLVCNVPCKITKNRKIPILPFCKKCKKAFFYQMSVRHRLQYRHSAPCRRGGTCEIDYRNPTVCSACQHKKFDTILKAQSLVFRNTKNIVRTYSSEVLQRYRRRRACEPYVRPRQQRWRWSIVDDLELKMKALTSLPVVVLKKLDESVFQQHASALFDAQRNKKALAGGEGAARKRGYRQRASSVRKIGNVSCSKKTVGKQGNRGQRDALMSSLANKVKRRLQNKTRASTVSSVVMNRLSPAQIKHSVLTQLLSSEKPPRQPALRTRESERCEINGCRPTNATPTNPVVPVPVFKKLTEDQNCLKLYMFSCGHACTACNSHQGLSWLIKNGFIPIDPVHSATELGQLAESKPQMSLNNLILAKLNEIAAQLSIKKTGTGAAADSLFTTKPIKPILAPVFTTATTIDPDTIYKGNVMAENTSKAQSFSLAQNSIAMNFLENLSASQAQNNNFRFMTSSSPPPAQAQMTTSQDGFPVSSSVAMSDVQSSLMSSSTATSFQPLFALGPHGKYILNTPPSTSFIPQFAASTVTEDSLFSHFRINEPVRRPRGRPPKTK